METSPSPKKEAQIRLVDSHKRLGGSTRLPMGGKANCQETLTVSSHLDGFEIRLGVD